MRGLVIGKGSIGSRHIGIIRAFFPDDVHIHIGSREFDGLIEGSGQISDGQHELKGFDFVVIASPASRHRSHLEAVLQGGLPAFVEKPLTATIEDSRALVETASSRQVPIQVGYVLRFSEAFARVRDLLDSRGTEGINSVTVKAHSYLPDWRVGSDFRESVSAKSELGGGVLLELSHELDYLLALFRQVEMIEASFYSSPDLLLDVETSVTARGKTAWGAEVSLSLDMASRDNERWCRIDWRDGMSVVWNLVGNTLTTVDVRGDSSTEVFLDNRDDWFRRQFEGFVEAARGLRKPSPSLPEGIIVMDLIEDIRSLGASS